MIWFSADWHFGWEGVLFHQPDRMNVFETIQEMDARFIASINATVPPNDILYFLGDFAREASRYGYYRSRLNVRNFHVVRGNHDQASLNNHCSVFDNMLFRKFHPGWECGHSIKIHMTHYPMLSWDGLYRGALHLYGHGHGCYEDGLDKIHPGRQSMDVGIDNIHRLTGEWRPISLIEVTERLGMGFSDDRVLGPFEEIQ